MTVTVETKRKALRVLIGGAVVFMVAVANGLAFGPWGAIPTIATSMVVAYILTIEKEK